MPCCLGQYEHTVGATERYRGDNLCSRVSMGSISCCSYGDLMLHCLGQCMEREAVTIFYKADSVSSY